MLALLDLALKHARPLGLVEAGDLEDLGRVEPAIRPPAHHGDILADPKMTVGVGSMGVSTTILASKQSSVLERLTSSDVHLVDAGVVSQVGVMRQPKTSRSVPKQRDVRASSSDPRQTLSSRNARVRRLEQVGELISSWSASGSSGRVAMMLLGQRRARRRTRARALSPRATAAAP